MPHLPIFHIWQTIAVVEIQFFCCGGNNKCNMRKEKRRIPRLNLPQKKTICEKDQLYAEFTDSGMVCATHIPHKLTINSR